MKRRVTPLALFFVGATFVCAAFVALRSGWFGFVLDSEEMAALFTGIGLAGVIATLYHDREKSAEDEIQQRKLIAMLAAQVKATCKATNNAAMIEAARVLRVQVDDLLDQPMTRPVLDELGELRPKLESLDKKIHEEAETLWDFGADGIDAPTKPN